MSLLGAVPTESSGIQLAVVLAHMLLVVDVNVLQGTCTAAEAAALESPPHLRRHVCATMFQVLSGSDDYVRKPMLMRWYHRLLRTVDTQAPGVLLAGLDI